MHKGMQRGNRTGTQPSFTLVFQSKERALAAAGYLEDTKNEIHSDVQSYLIVTPWNERGLKVRSKVQALSL